MTELDRLIMLYTGDRPDGSRVLGAQGLSYEDHQRLTNLLIEEVKRLKKALLQEITDEAQKMGIDGDY